MSRGREDRGRASTKRREVVKQIVKLRGELEAQGHDAGGEAIAYHLAQARKTFPPSRASGAFCSRLYKIGLGRAHKGRVIKLLIADQSVRVTDSEGQLIRELTLDPSRTYQPISPAYDVHDVPTHVSGMS